MRAAGVLRTLPLRPSTNNGRITQSGYPDSGPRQDRRAGPPPPVDHAVAHEGREPAYVGSIATSHQRSLPLRRGASVLYAASLAQKSWVARWRSHPPMRARRSCRRHARRTRRSAAARGRRRRAADRVRPARRRRPRVRDRAGEGQREQRPGPFDQHRTVLRPERAARGQPPQQEVPPAGGADRARESHLLRMRASKTQFGGLRRRPSEPEISRRREIVRAAAHASPFTTAARLRRRISVSRRSALRLVRCHRHSPPSGRSAPRIICHATGCSTGSSSRRRTEVSTSPTTTASWTFWDYPRLARLVAEAAERSRPSGPGDAVRSRSPCPQGRSSWPPSSAAWSPATRRAR